MIASLATSWNLKRILWITTSHMELDTWLKFEIAIMGMLISCELWNIALAATLILKFDNPAFNRVQCDCFIQ
jgi:hypothetical protein